MSDVSESAVVDTGCGPKYRTKVMRFRSIIRSPTPIYNISYVIPCRRSGSELCNTLPQEGLIISSEAPIPQLPMPQ